MHRRVMLQHKHGREHIHGKQSIRANRVLLIRTIPLLARHSVGLALFMLDMVLHRDIILTTTPIFSSFASEGLGNRDKARWKDSTKALGKMKERRPNLKANLMGNSNMMKE